MAGVPATELLDQFQERRTWLAALARRASDVAGELDDAGLADELERLAEETERDHFKVLVVGEFKQGKSTLVNALIGSEILPASPRPMTAVTTVVTYGEELQAFVYPRGATAPEAVPVERLRSYIAIQPENPDDRDRYAQAEIRLPSRLCQDGVQLIDTPGLDDSEASERASVERLLRADAVVLVLNAMSVSSTSTREVVSDAAHVRPDGIFFVFNRIDQVSQEDLPEVTRWSAERLTSMLDGYFSVSEDRIFFTSALNAMHGRVDGDDYAFQASGVPQLEQGLYTFLGSVKGRERISFRASSLRGACLRSLAVIAERSDSLRTGSAVIRSRLQAEEPGLIELDQCREGIRYLLGKAAETIEREITNQTTAFIKQLAEDCPSVALEADIGADFFAGARSTRLNVEAMMRKVGQEIQDHIRKQTTRWQDRHLAPAVTELASGIDDELGRRLLYFSELLNRIVINIYGHHAGERSSFFGEVRMSDYLIQENWQLVSYVSGSADITAFASTTGQHGRSGLPASVTTAGTIASMLSPVLAGAFMPLTLGWSGIQALSARSRFDDRVRRYIGEEAKHLLLDNAADVAREFAQRLVERCDVFRDSLDAQLKREISALHDAALTTSGGVSTREMGDPAVGTSMDAAQLERLESEMRQIVDRCHDLIGAAE